MPIDASLTPRRCALLILVILGIISLIVASFLSDLRLDTRESPGDYEASWSKETAGGTDGENGRFSAEKDTGSSPGYYMQHLHWFVQISDLHVSMFYDKQRTNDLRKFCEETLIEVVVPEVVLVTGDITDAKLEDREGSRQFEDEWRQYDRILHETGVLDKTVWLDTRGNHDAFDVPSLTSHENYFSIYAARGRRDKQSYHYLHETWDGDIISFIAVDACPDPGPRRPFNFFGVLSQSEMQRLQQFVRDSQHASQIIFFGHYPTSTIGSALYDVRKLFGHGAMYLCGHLHTLGGLMPNMYSRQKTGYLELELADWKDQRVYRLLAFDHGLMSFVDAPFHSWPVVLITNPKNALLLVPGHEPTHRIKRSTHIRMLVFAPAAVSSVKVQIDGVYLGEAEQSKGPLYVLEWEPFQYIGGLHSVVVQAVTVTGEETVVEQQFSVDDTRPSFRFYQRYILMSDHATIFKTLFVLCFITAVLPLVLLKIFRVHFHVVAQSSQVSGCFLRLVRCWVRRLCLLCNTPSVFYPLLVYNIYIAVGPWFIGEVLAGHVGACFVFGFIVSGTFVPTVLTYVYGAVQLFTFSIPLTLYLARCLDITTIHCHRDGVDTRLPGRLRPVVWLLDHCFFFVIIGIQAYLVLSGFYRSYGGLALLLCPLRTWAIILAVYLRRQSLSAGAQLHESCITNTVSLQQGSSLDTS